MTTDSCTLKETLTCCFFPLPIHTWESQIPKYLPQMSAFSLLCPLKYHRVAFWSSETSYSSKTTWKNLRDLIFEQRSQLSKNRLPCGLNTSFSAFYNLRQLGVSQKNVLTNCVRVKGILRNHNCMQQSWNLTWILQAPGWETPKDTKEIMKVLFARLGNHWQHGY